MVHLAGIIATVLGLLAMPCVGAALEGNRRRFSFSVEQVHVPSYRRHGGDHFIKGPGEGPGSLRRRRRSCSKAPTYSVPNDIYLTPIKVGDSILNMQIDSGIADLWVLSQTAVANSTSHPYYVPSSSSSTINSDGWKLGGKHSVGGDTVTGSTVMQDQIELSELKYPRQSILVADWVSDSFLTRRPAFSGSVGIALSSDTAAGQRGFFDNVAPQLDEPVIGIAIRGGGKPGIVDFGFTNSEQYVGELAYTPADTTDGKWKVQTEGYTFGGGYPAVETRAATIETSYTLLLAPNEVAAKVYSNVGIYRNEPLPGYYVPCDATVPEFTLNIGGVFNVTIPSEHLKYQPVGNNECYGGVQPSNEEYFMLGNTFLRSVYVVFDMRGPSVGLAPQRVPEARSSSMPS